MAWGGIEENDVTQAKILPRGLKINLTVNEVSYEWVFSLLNTGLLKKKLSCRIWNSRTLCKTIFP